MTGAGSPYPASAFGSGFPHDWSRSIRRIPDRALLFLGALSLCASIALTLAADAYSRQVHWQHAGASVFGGACEYGHIGYRGDDLRARWRSFAELRMGTALGGLPYGAKIRVLDPDTHRRLTIRKRDIGAGGNNVAGIARSIDLWQPVAHYLNGAGCSWTGVVLWRLVR